MYLNKDPNSPLLQWKREKQTRAEGRGLCVDCQGSIEIKRNEMKMREWQGKARQGTKRDESESEGESESESESDIDIESEIVI